jgi:hypothetical protein
MTASVQLKKLLAMSLKGLGAKTGGKVPVIQ